MATKLKFEVFRDLYQEELERSTSLRNTAATYLAVISFLGGGLALKGEDLWAGRSTAATTFAALSIVGFGAALLLLALAVGLFRHETLFHPIKVIEAFGSAEPTDEEFLDDRLVDAAAAWRTNKAANDQRARLIRCATWLVVLGVFFGFAAPLTHALNRT
jgi:hypothetical protein